jgi:hypothetical protein
MPGVRASWLRGTGAVMIGLCAAIVSLPARSTGDRKAMPAGGNRATAFAWGVPCRVPVTVIGVKQGATVKSANDVVLELGADRSELRVRLEHFRFLEIDGVDVTIPARRKDVEPAELLAEVIPAIRVARTGEFLGVVDLEKAVTWLLEQPMFKAKIKDADQLRKLLLSPQMLQAMQGEMAQIWRAWVSGWLDNRLGPGQTVELQQSMIAAESFVVPTRLSHLGEVRGAPGLVRFRLENTVRGKPFASVAGGFLKELVANLATPPGAPVQIVDGERQEVDEVETDPTTLRPRHARYEVKVHAVFSDGKDTRQVQSRDTTFHWDRAQGACASKRPAAPENSPR